MFTIRLVDSTACLLLENNTNGNGYIDHHFINKFHYENFMTKEDIENEASRLAAKNNVINYTLDLSEFKKENKV